MPGLLAACNGVASLSCTLCNINVSTAAPALLAAEIKSLDPDPLDTERFASASDYSKGENLTPAKSQLQTIIRREKQRVRLHALQIALLVNAEPNCNRNIGSWRVQAR